MDLGKTSIWGNTNPREVFAPAGAAVSGERPPLRATIQWGWLKNKLEDVGYIKPEHYKHAAAQGAGTVATGERAAFAGTATAAANAGQATVSSNPIYGGMYSQMLQREHGFVVPMARAEHLPGAAVAGVADDVADAAAPAVAEAVAAADTPLVAAADDVAAKVATLEQQFIEGFQRLGTLAPEQRIPTLARAIDAGSVAGHGGDAFDVLASTLAARPLEHSVPALHSSIDDAIKLAPKAAEVAEVVVKSAPAVTEVVAKAAPAVTEALTHSAPVLDEVVHAAAAVAPAITKVLKPAVIEAALPVSDDVLRYGLKGVMGFGAGIDDTIRLLAKI